MENNGSASNHEPDEDYFRERETAWRRGQRAIAEFESENRTRLATIGIPQVSRPTSAAPLPGWNFGSGNSGIIE